MTRVRTDTVFGTTTNAPLTAAGTTLNSAGLANLAAVSSAEAIIVLDPNREAGAPEIVVVTAHTGSATSATIQRGQFGTTARQHEVGTEWVHGPIASNATTYATAADDQGDFVPMNAWETYTPTLTQLGAVTKTVNYARYTRIGRLIRVEVHMTCTGSGTANNAVTIGLPVAAAYSAEFRTVGTFFMLDASVAFYFAAAVLGSSTTVQGLANGDAVLMGVTGADFAVALVSGDKVSIEVTYEAAS